MYRVSAAFAADNAFDADKITELMKENNIEIEYTASFKTYGKLVVDEFPKYKKGELVVKNVISLVIWGER